jgi:hypothetical protein
MVKSHSTYSGFGDISGISDFNAQSLFECIEEELLLSNVIVVEASDIQKLDAIVSLLFPGIDGTNVAVCIVVGYAEGAMLPKFPVAPVVGPSWTIIGPDLMETLDLKNPHVYALASQRLTRIEKVN